MIAVKTIIAATVLLTVVAAFEYNPEVEDMILKQKKNWIEGKKIGRFKKLALSQADLDFFDGYTSKLRGKAHKEDNEKKNDRVKRQVGGTRMEYRCLTATQRTSYHSALQKMKNNLVGSLTEYDNFVARYSPDVAISGHFGPSFGPWHREYLATMERAIQKYCPTCNIPYWDSRLDKRLGGNPANSIMFSPLTFGNAVGVVTTGFAANWAPKVPQCIAIRSTLYRNMNTNSASFYDDKDVTYLSSVKRHEDIAYPWSTQFEYSHGYVHNAFGAGSHMSDIMCSPSDPIFISHHCFIDLLFEKARLSMIANNDLNYADTTQLPATYDDSDGHISVDCAANSSMNPFPYLVNKDGLLSNYYTSVMYTYERTPGDITCSKDTDCCGNQNTQFIWCNLTTKKCVSKIREGGKIVTGIPVKACYCPAGKSAYISTNTCKCR